MKTCPRCGAELSDEHTFCSVCGTVLTGAEVSLVIDKIENEHSKRRKKRLIALGIIAALIIGGVVFAYMQNANIRAAYNNISEELKNNPLNVSSNLTTAAKELSEKTEPFYISSGLKQDVNQLNERINSYSILGKMYNDISTLGDKALMDNAASYRTKLNQISSDEVKATVEYNMVKTTIETVETQVRNKTWGENTINDFKTNCVDTISSWSRRYNVVYYYGSAMLEETNDYDFVLGIVDNDGVKHRVKFEYKFDNDSWDEGLNELYDYLKANPTCVMAVGAASGYYGYYDRGFIYNYKK